MQSLVEVYSAADAIEASAVCDLLEEAGIHAHMVGENLQSSLGAVPQGNVHPRIWTNDDDAPRARQLLHAWNQLHHGKEVNPKRELLQFSLRAIFVVVTTSALLAACY